MARLRTLGGLAIESSVSTPGLTGRRPLALLAILAAGDPMSRDKIIALLWPERDTERGRNVLNQTLFGIRRALGADVVVGRNDLRLDLNVLESDRAELEGAMQRGDIDRVIQLYSGSFLDGFFLSGAAEFERWVEVERAGLKRRVIDAIRARAAARLIARDPGASAEDWRRLLAIEPFDEAAAVSLIRALIAAGDRLGAMQFARDHEARVRSELDEEPSPAVIETLAELRRSPDPRRSPPRILAPDAVAGPPASAPAREPIREPPASVSGYWLQRRRAAIATALLIAVAVLALAEGARLLSSPRHALASYPSTASPTDIAVFPFRVRGSDSLSYMSGATLELLSRDLDEAGAIRAIDPRRISRATHDSSPVDLHTAAAIARSLDAQRFVLGEVFGADSLSLTATVYDAATEARLGRASVTQSRLAPMFAIDALAEGLAASQAPHEDRRIVATAARTTGSVEAFKAFMRGDEHYREGRYAESLEDFEEAVRADSMFALAYYRLAMAADWASRMPLVLPAAERAAALSSRLGEHDRLMVLAHLAWREARTDDAEQLYRTVLRAHPDDAEAWYQLGELLFHENHLRGRSFTESKDAFRHLLELEPLDQGAITHLGRIAARQRDRSLLDSLIQRGAPVLPVTDSRELRALRAFTNGTPGEQRTIIDEYASVDLAGVPNAVWRVAVFSGDIEGADRLLQPALAENAPLSIQVDARDQRVWLDAARGRFDQVADDLNWLALREGAAGDARRVDESFLILLPFTQIAASAGERIRASLDSARRGLTGVPASYSTCLSALISARMSDSLRAASAVVRLGGDTARAPNDFELRKMAASCARGVRARLALAAADSATALRELLADRQYYPVDEPHEPVDRFLLAELLLRSGHPSEAAGWYASIADHGMEELALRPLAAERLAEIARRR